MDVLRCCEHHHFVSTSNHPTYHSFHTLLNWAPPPSNSRDSRRNWGKGRPHCRRIAIVVAAVAAAAGAAAWYDSGHWHCCSCSPHCCWKCYHRSHLRNRKSWELGRRWWPLPGRKTSDTSTVQCDGDDGGGDDDDGAADGDDCSECH